MTEKPVTITTRHKGRRKKRDRPKLDFVESPLDDYTYVQHPDFGEPIEFPINQGQMTQWVSPQIKNLNQSMTPKKSRMKRESKNKNNKLKKKNTENDISTISQYNETMLSPSNRMVTRGLLTRMTTPQYNKENAENDEGDSPMAPSCLSTPDILGSNEKSRGRTPLHFLFQAQTPVTRNCIVLVENTPM